MPGYPFSRSQTDPFLQIDQNGSGVIPDKQDHIPSTNLLLLLLHTRTSNIMNANQENNDRIIFIPGFPRDGVLKTLVKLKFGDFVQYVRNAQLKIAEWNRDAVPNHPGNAKDWLKSILNRLSLGIRIGYRNGKVTALDKLTPGTPILLSDGGHRTRWDMEIVDKLLKTLSPDDQKIVLDTVIHINVTTHVDGLPLDDYAKAEYQETNRKIKSLTNGENLRANSNPALQSLIDAMTSILDLRTESKDMPREAVLESVVGAIAGMMNGLDHMTKRATDVLGLEVKPEKMEQVLKIITNWKDMEEELYDMYAANPAALKMLRSRTFDLKYDGRFIVGLIEATDEAEVTRAKDAIIGAYEVALSKFAVADEFVDEAFVAAPAPEGLTAAAARAHKKAEKARESAHKKAEKARKAAHEKLGDQSIKAAKKYYAEVMNSIGGGGAGGHLTKKSHQDGWKRVVAKTAPPVDLGEAPSGVLEKA